MKKNLGKIIGALILLGIAVWVIFYIVNDRDNGIYANESEEDTEVKSLLSKDLDGFYYPSTAREVVALYQKIHKNLSNKTLTQDEFEGLVDQMRKLLDPEFLENNPRSEHITRYHDEVVLMKNAKKSVSTTKVQLESASKKYTSENGDKMVSIVGYILVTGPSVMEKSYERFYLREDENGRYRILGWESCEAVDM